MELQVDGRKDGDYLPGRYSSDGENVSPEVHWAGVPERTSELALVFENGTPHTQAPFVQWLVYHIPPDGDGQHGGIRHNAYPEEPPVLLQGKNSRRNDGHDGPPGTVSRRYGIALIEHHVLAEAERHIDYQRPS